MVARGSLKPNVGVRISNPQPQFFQCIKDSYSNIWNNLLNCATKKRVLFLSPYWGLVQLAERQILTLEVKGSNPLPPAKVRVLLDGTKR